MITEHYYQLEGMPKMADKAIELAEQDEEWADSSTSEEEAISIESVSESGEDLFGNPL